MEGYYYLENGRRVMVEYDQYADNPLELIDWEGEYHQIDNYRMWRGWDTPSDQFARFVHEIHYRFGRHSDITQEIVRRYLRIMGEDWDEQVFVLHYQGYSKSDWATYVFVGEYGDQEAETFFQWLRGDVLSLTEEAMTEYYPNGDTEEESLEVWEVEEFLGSLYVKNTDDLRENIEYYSNSKIIEGEGL